MPTYEYICKDCGSSFEVFQSMRDEPLKSCPECGQEIRRVINGGGGVIFKGPGFYSTDKTKAQTKKVSGGDAKPTDKTEAVKSEVNPPSPDEKKKQKNEEKEAG